MSQDLPVASPPSQSPTSASAPVAIRHLPPDARPGGLQRILAFLGWVFTGFGLGPVLLRQGTKETRAEITVYSAHRAFNLWMLILVGFVGAVIVKHWPDGKAPSVMGWIYVWAMIYTFVTVLFDFGTLKLLLWTAILVLLWVALKYIEDLRGIPILSRVVTHFYELKPRLDPGFASVISWMLLPPWVGALFLTFTNGRKRFTPNEITEWYIGEGTELLDRMGLKFRTRYRDIFETLLGFGAGDLIAFDNRQNVVKRFDNVLFLIFLWPKLDSLLQERQTRVDNEPGNPVEVAPARSETPVG